MNPLSWRSLSTSSNYSFAGGGGGEEEEFDESDSIIPLVGFNFTDDGN